MTNIKLFILRHKIISLLIILVMISAIYLLIHPELVLVWKGEFSQKGWYNYPSCRYRIIDDMEEKIDIWNLTAEEILDILGPADSEFYSDDCIVYIHYLIKGMANILPFYSSNLYYIVTFSGDGTVEEIRIYESS